MYKKSSENYFRKIFAFLIEGYHPIFFWAHDELDFRPDNKLLTAPLRFLPEQSVHPELQLPKSSWAHTDREVPGHEPGPLPKPFSTAASRMV